MLKKREPPQKIPYVIVFDEPIADSGKLGKDTNLNQNIPPRNVSNPST